MPTEPHYEYYNLDQETVPGALFRLMSKKQIEREEVDNPRLLLDVLPE